MRSITNVFRVVAALNVVLGYDSLLIPQLMPQRHIANELAPMMES